MKRPKIYPILVVVLLAITIPYGLAALIAGSEHVFIGFLLNPSDGASYLAKMYEGWSGAWQFTLPYTAAQGNGTYLFLFYLFLGHLARWLGLPLILVYHLARILGAGLLLVALLQFFAQIFRDRPDLYRIALWLTALGSGMGWLVIFLGATPSDFWVAEAYPFLAMFTNPHFPLGLALLIVSFTLLLNEQARFRGGLLLLYGLLIAIIFPFGLVVMLLIAGAWMIWLWLETRRLAWQPLLCIGLLGGPFLLYQFWIAQTDPLLAIWNAQNLTPSPPVWDFILSFSPALILAIFGIYHLWNMKENPARRICIAWFGLGLLLIYLPFSLQRRFMLGFYIPIAVLAVYGVDYLRQRLAQRVRWLLPTLFGLSYPTTILLILIGLIGAMTHAPELYMTQDEARALAWIQAQTPSQTIILASPAMGRLIPAISGRRVIYGHPFETVNADKQEQRVLAFFNTQGKAALASDLLTNAHVDYLLYGPRELKLGGNPDLSAFPLVFETGSVRIYAVKQAH